MMTEEIHPLVLIQDSHDTELRSKSYDPDHHNILLDKAAAAAANNQSSDRFVEFSKNWVSSRKVLNKLFDMEDKDHDANIDQTEWEQLYPLALKAFRVNETDREKSDLRAKAFRFVSDQQLKKIELERKAAAENTCGSRSSSTSSSVNIISCVEAVCSNDLDGYVTAIFQAILGPMEKDTMKNGKKSKLILNDIISRFDRYLTLISVFNIVYFTLNILGTTTARNIMHRMNVYNACDADHDGTVQREELLDGFEKSLREELAGPLQVMHQNCEDHLKSIVPELEKLVEKKIEKENEGRDGDCVCIIM